MTERLLSFFKHFLFTLLLLPLTVALTPATSFSQSAGDVAFLGYDGDSDGFSVVLFTSYSASDEIHFNSQEWDGSDFVGTGGDFTWVAPSGGTTAGVVLVFSDVNGTPTVNVGSITDDANMNLLVGGDVIYAYTGTDKDTPSTPFLGAIATDGSLYTQPDGTQGTLVNTGLAEAGNETITLTTDIDVAKFTGDRSGNTPNGYRNELNDIGNNWQEENGSGDQSGLVLPFSTTTFTIISPPTVAFTTTSVDSSEGSGAADLTVELVEANGTAVDVDVVFLSGSSTATDGEDFDDGSSSYMTQTVSFGSGATSGATQTVTITLTNDGTFEGTKTAVFRLQNNDAGSIISPEVLTLTINDDDAPDIVINEFLADPPAGLTGDANGDGIRDSGDDEFMEIVNNESSDLDISGWQLSDDGGTSITHTFPNGTVLPAGQAIVVFGGGSPTGGFGGAIVQTAGNLSFTNSGGNATLLDASGNVLQDISYGGAGEPDGGDDQSVTRDPDISGTFTGHTTADAGDDSSPFSPGTQIDGTAFGSATFAIGIRGSEGWRMVSSPTSGTTFNDMFADLWTQGIPGSDDPSGGGTQFGWTESGGGSFVVPGTPPGSMSETMTPGKGYIVYVFEDDEFSTPGVQGGFPKTISTSDTENSSPVSVAVSANDQSGNSTIDGNEGWNLLGNPFGTDISVDALFTALEAVDANVNTNLSIWNPDTDNWEILTKGDGDTIAPFQAFFVRYENASGVSGSVSMDRSNLAANTGTQFFKQANETRYEFTISLKDENSSDPYHIEFSEKGTGELDRYDAYKLFSLNPDAINLYSIEGNNKLLKNALPDNLNEITEIPLAFEAPNRNKLTFKWEGISELPQYWDVTLIDRTLGRELDLRRSAEYKFSFQQPVQNKTAGQNEPLYKTTSTKNGDVRFVLRVNPGLTQTVGSETLPSSVELNPNYPNPFNPTTTISYSLTQETQVKMTVWNIVGQKVATLVDGVVEAGTHTELWNASDMPSGIYIAQMEVGGNVYIRKMTLIK